MKSESQMQANPPAARDKILTIDQLAAIAAEARRGNRTVVLAHGAFDLLHLGHVRHLELARQQGDLLIVTITADRFLNKGPGRPVFTAALSCVDCVGVNEAPTSVNVLNAIRPDVYVKGSDYVESAADITGKIADAANTGVARDVKKAGAGPALRWWWWKATQQPA